MARPWVISLIVFFVLLGGCAQPAPPPTPAGESSGGAEMVDAPILPATPATTSPEPRRRDYWPTEGWRTSTPEEQGLDPARLEATMAYLEETGADVESVLVIRHGYIVLEEYPGGDHDADSLFKLWSATKSVTSALAGIALHQGLLKSVDQKLVEFFPDRITVDRDAGKEEITLEHLLTMSPGYRWDEGAGGQMRRSADAVQYVLDQPMETAPGSAFHYGDGASHLLSAILSQVTGQSALEFAHEHLFGPLGITDVRWMPDPQGNSLGGSGLYLTPRDMAKIGYLYLNDGVWDGEEILPPGWVTRSTATYFSSDWDWEGQGYGYQWWTLPEGGVHFAHGLWGQAIFVVPEADMVVVFTANIRHGYDPEFEMLRGFLGATGKRRHYAGYGFSFEHPAGMLIHEGGPLWESTSAEEGMVQFIAYPGPSQVVNVTWETTKAPRSLDGALEDSIERVEKWARSADYELAFAAEGEPLHSTVDGHEVVVRRYSLEEEGRQSANVFGIWYCDESDRLFTLSSGALGRPATDPALVAELQEHLDAFSCH